MTRSIARISAGVALVVALAVPAIAGPPLLCHPFSIGTAKSLPWNGTHSWFEGQPGYDLGRLAADTDALLAPSTPVVVRMETLRRAAIYASGDRRIAERMLATLTDRALATERAGKTDALAFLDAAYFAGALRQIGMLGTMPEFRERAPLMRAVAASADPYAFMQKSLAAAGNEPAFDFAAALIAADSRRDAYLTHAKKARDGASKDALVAQNLSHIGGN